LDLDFVDKETLGRIIYKIWGCRLCGYSANLVGVKDTLKGYHMELRCRGNCELCRLVFDDPVRYSRDLRRPVFSRDVLFDCKELVRNGM